MKAILRSFFVNLGVLYFVSTQFKGMSFASGFATYSYTAITLTLLLIFAKPVINLLLLPLNLVTFGFFRWVSSGVAMYLASLLVKDFQIKGFYFAGFQSKWLDIPQIELTNFMAYFAFAFVISVLITSIHWLIK